MTTMTAVTKTETTRAHRPQPGPARWVAPPAPQTYAPWLSVLDQTFAPGKCRWVLDDEGSLVPVPSDDANTAGPKRISVPTWLSALLRR